MDFGDIQKVNMLSNEKLAIQAATAMLSSGGRINTMTVVGGIYNGPMPGPPGMGVGMFPTGGPVTVQTHFLQYPQPMIDAIVSGFQTRLSEITQELEQLGVTGMEQRRQ